MLSACLFIFMRPASIDPLEDLKSLMDVREVEVAHMHTGIVLYEKRESGKEDY